MAAQAAEAVAAALTPAMAMRPEQESMAKVASAAAARSAAARSARAATVEMRAGTTAAGADMMPNPVDRTALISVAAAGVAARELPRRAPRTSRGTRLDGMAARYPAPSKGIALAWDNSRR